MAEKVLEYLYPEISNLYGDPFNIKYLVKCLEVNNATAVLKEDSLNEAPYFKDGVPDLIYMGPMTEHSQELAIERLMPYRERIIELIKSDVVFLITGNALEIFGQGIECEDGRFIKGLDIFPFTGKRKMFDRYNSLFLGEFEGIKVVGNKSQFSHGYKDSSVTCSEAGGPLSGNSENGRYLSADGFIRVIRGDGLCPGESYEGIRNHNFFATYLLGPLLPLNPALTAYFLKLLKIDDPVTAFEKEAVKAYEIRLAEFENPKTELK